MVGTHGGWFLVMPATPVLIYHCWDADRAYSSGYKCFSPYVISALSVFFLLHMRPIVFRTGPYIPEEVPFPFVLLLLNFLVYDHFKISALLLDRCACLYDMVFMFDQYGIRKPPLMIAFSPPLVVPLRSGASMCIPSKSLQEALIFLPFLIFYAWMRRMFCRYVCWGPLNGNIRLSSVAFTPLHLPCFGPSVFSRPLYMTRTALLGFQVRIIHYLMCYLTPC